MPLKARADIGTGFSRAIEQHWTRTSKHAILEK
jgi:hypothetical protein